MRLWVPSCARLVPLLLVPALLQAQPVRGLGDDALTAPRGSIRIQVSTAITDFSQRYGKNSPGRRDGSLEPLDVDFSVDTLGVTQFPGLSTVQSALRTLTGNNAFSLSLGRSELTSSVRVQTTPILLEAGITNRLTLGVMVPIVSARKQASFNINGDSAIGNVSFNPGRLSDTAAATNSRVIAALDSARAGFNVRYIACDLRLQVLGCAEVLAAGTELRGDLATFIQGLKQVYGTTRTEGGVFVPIAGSAADSIILARIEQYRTRLNSFGGSLGTTALTPSRPTAPVTPDGIRRVVGDSTLGLVAAPIGTITRQGLGDVEVSLKLRLFDTFGARSDTLRFRPAGLSVRQSIAGVYRLGTGRMDEAANYLDVGTGDGQNDVEVRSFTDVLYGRRFFGSVVVRYTVQLPDQLERRITDVPEQVWAKADRQQLVDRNLGDQLQVEFTPRYVLNDYFALGAQYLFRRKAEDVYASTSFTAGATTIDSRTLGLETQATEQRIGWGITFSALAAYDRGKARLPLEVQYFNSRTVAGSGGAVPKLSIHQVQVRYYPRR
jgi:hypothetical protein